MRVEKEGSMFTVTGRFGKISRFLRKAYYPLESLSYVIDDPDIYDVYDEMMVDEGFTVKKCVNDAEKEVSEFNALVKSTTGVESIDHLFRP